MKIIKPHLATLIDRLAASRRIIAPVRNGDHTDLAPIASLGEADFSEVITRSSIKQFLFPPTEAILRFTTDGRSVRYDEAAPPAPRETVILGCRPCDAAALPLLDQVFGWDCDDCFYAARRAATTLISISCTDCDAACFCTAVGLRPNSRDGSDLLLTPLDDDTFLAEACTQKGRELIEGNADIFDHGDADGNAACAAALAKLPAPIDLAKVRAWLESHFDDPFWAAESLTCLGCGACTYTCPTCYCFDIVDEPTGDRGVRRRNWDSCQFGDFTRHTSGHNPRPDRASRWRQRVMHKFAWYEERFGRHSCVGCGRCRRVCPVGMDIAEQLRKIEEQA